MVLLSQQEGLTMFEKDTSNNQDAVTEEELEIVNGGNQLVVCKYPATPEDTCGTKGPGPHIPVLS